MSGVSVYRKIFIPFQVTVCVFELWPLACTPSGSTPVRENKWDVVFLKDRHQVWWSACVPLMDSPSLFGFVLRYNLSSLTAQPAALSMHACRGLVIVALLALTLLFALSVMNKFQLCVQLHFSLQSFYETVLTNAQADNPHKGNLANTWK